MEDYYPPTSGIYETRTLKFIILELLKYLAETAQWSEPEPEWERNIEWPEDTMFAATKNPSGPSSGDFDSTDAQISDREDELLQCEDYEAEQDPTFHGEVSGDNTKSIYFISNR
jgi:hypothetical protein